MHHEAKLRHVLSLLLPLLYFLGLMTTHDPYYLSSFFGMYFPVLETSVENIYTLVSPIDTLIMKQVVIILICAGIGYIVGSFLSILMRLAR